MGPSYRLRKMCEGEREGKRVLSNECGEWVIVCAFSSVSQSLIASFSIHALSSLFSLC